MTIADFVNGDDLEIQRDITIPSGTLITNAWFMVKHSVLDDDTEALIDKSVTVSFLADVGYIQDNGVSDYIARIIFFLTPTDTNILTPFSEYPYSVKVKLDTGRVYTPERGVIIANPAVKKLSV
jgi:hypothetical protein